MPGKPQRPWVWVIEYWPYTVRMGTRTLKNLETAEIELEEEFRQRMAMIERSGGYVYFYGKKRHPKVDVNAAA